MDKKLLSTSLRHQRKFQSLLQEHSILTGIKNNPNQIITNLNGDQLTNEEETILTFGFKHNLGKDRMRQKSSPMLNQSGNSNDRTYYPTASSNNRKSKMLIKHLLVISLT